MLDITRQFIKKKKITDNLSQVFYESIDKQKLMLEVDYMNRKFVIERSFQNNLYGKDGMDAAIKEFDSEEKVRKYLNLPA